MQSLATVLFRQSLATATVETTAARRRRRRKRMRSLNVEQQPQQTQAGNNNNGQQRWKCRLVLAFAVLTIVTLLYAITLFARHRTANNESFMLINLIAFVLSEGTYIFCCSNLINSN
uniref:Uncharacterized protein n=1 Tax=Globodera rostochiensis TaxID=31243 RepID=A0A914HJH0_GLORO